jgi:voltage-gated potassium channel
VAIGIVSWLVFVVDVIVHGRLLQQFLRTRLGMFDLAIVVLTAPWFLLPGTFAGGGFIVVLRLARLARLVVGSRRVRQLVSRLGQVALVALAVMFGGAVVAYYAEHAANPEFATFGDSMWWAVVTLTTVGYGDITPETTTGRSAAVMIMITGVAVLGLLAGSLASFFRLQPDGSAREPATPDGSAVADPPATPAPPAADTAAQPDLDRVLHEISELRAQVGELSPLKAQLAQLAQHTAHLRLEGLGTAGQPQSPNDAGD